MNHRQIINGRLRNHRAEEAGSMLGEKKSVQMSALIPFHVHTYTIIINHVCLTCILKGGTWKNFVPSDPEWDNMLGLPGGFARNFNMWGGVGWGVSTLVFMCTHGTLLVCWCVHMVRGVGWGVSTLVFMCTHGTLLVCWCVHMVRCWCVDVWGGVGWDVSTLVFMCTHGTLLVCWCVHMVRGVGWGGVGCVNVGVHVGWGVHMVRGVGCVNVGVHVYTWYAAGVLMCTHGTLLVCWCVHMVRCWCVHMYTWYAAGVLMCTHGTLLVCSCVHMVRCWCVMCKRITQSQCHVWLSIVSSSWLGSMYFFLPCVSFLSDSFCLLLVYVIYIYMYVYFMSVYICMQIVSNGNAVNYRWLLIFPPKKLKFGHCQNIQWSIASGKKDMKSTCEQPHFIWKNTVKSTPWLQEQQTAADTHHM